MTDSEFKRLVQIATDRFNEMVKTATAAHKSEHYPNELVVFCEQNVGYSEFQQMMWSASNPLILDQDTI